MLDPASRARFNLEGASVLLLDDTPMGMSILVQIVTGLGAKILHRCDSVDSARDAVGQNLIDLAVVDALAPTGAGYDFVKWLRGSGLDPNCYAPVLLTTAHTPAGDVTRARDCGGHIMVKKPIAPQVMLERIIWMAKTKRPFVFADEYVGPDRRIRSDGAPKDGGRRREDVIAAAEGRPEISLREAS